MGDSPWDISPLFDSVSLAERLVALSIDCRHLSVSHLQTLRNFRALTSLEVCVWYEVPAAVVEAAFEALLVEAPLLPRMTSIELVFHVAMTGVISVIDALVRRCSALQRLHHISYSGRLGKGELVALRARITAAAAERPNFEVVIG
jgi:hypothetical protein